MAKVTAPLYSETARGSIADTLTFQKNGTTQTVKRWRAPQKRITPQQLLRRDTYRAATRAWSLLTTTQKRLYAPTDQSDLLSAWQRFLSLYLRDPSNFAGTTWDHATTTWDSHTTTWD